MKRSRLLVGIVTLLLGSSWALAQSVDWNFYASVRAYTFLEHKETADGKTFADGEDKDLDYDHGLMGTSRVGAKIKVDDNFSGLAEVAMTETTVNLRHLIGVWNFGKGALTIGQTRTPIGRQDSLRTRSEDLGLTAFGEPYLGRRPLLQLEMYGIKVAASKAHTATNFYANTNITSEADTYMPRLEMSWTKKTGMTTWDLMGGFHTYSIATPEKDFHIHSGLVGGGIMLRPDPAYIRAIGYYARNARQFGQMLNVQPASFGSAKISDDNQVIDNDLFGGALFGGYKFNDRIKAEIGYGYIQSKDDSAGAKTEKWQCYYAQASVKLHKNITLVPEAGVMEDIETDQRVAYIGAKWQADF